LSACLHVTWAAETATDIHVSRSHPVYLCVFISLFLFLSLYVCLLICLCLSLSLSVSVSVSLCMSVCLSLFLSLSVSFSICLYLSLCHEQIVGLMLIEWDNDWACAVHKTERDWTAEKMNKQQKRA
jgi:hypothetical protein